MSKQPLDNHIAVVTGASSGIGRAIALALAREGAQLALAARNVALLNQVAQEIERLGRQALIVPTDVSNQAQVEQMIAATLARWQRVDLLIANAGAYIRQPVVKLTAADLVRALAVNFYGAVYPTLAVLPHMLQQRRGHIVFINSVDGKKGTPLDAPYVSAKFALAGFADVMRQELYGTGVHVTSVFPGRVDTPMLATLKVPWISPKLAPEAVARATVSAIHRKQAEVIIPLLARPLIYLNIFFPRLADWAVRLFHLEGWET